MPQKINTRNELVAFIEQQLKDRYIPFLMGARDELLGAEMFGADNEPQYLAGTRFIQKLEKGEQPAPVPTSICSLELVDTICSYFEK